MPAQLSPYSSRQSESVRLEVEDVTFLQNGPYSFLVRRSECVGLSGQSGVGKTLLLKAICDLIPYEGCIRCDGVDAVSIEAPKWRKNVCMIPADPVWWHDTVGSHFSVVNNTVKRLLAKVGFEGDVLDWETGRLSTGERQRLGLVRGLLLDPSVLLLDEPTSGLDRENSDLVENLIASYQQERGVAVIWVGHNYRQLERVADRILKVKKTGLD